MGQFGGINMKAVFLVFIILAVTSVHSRRVQKKEKNDESNEKLNNDDEEFFNELKSEESDRDLNEVKENSLSHRSKNRLSRSKRWVSYGCYWGGYNYCGCYNLYYYYCTTWYYWRKQNGEQVDIPVRPPPGEDVKTPPKAHRRMYRGYQTAPAPAYASAPAYAPAPAPAYPEPEPHYPQPSPGYGESGGYRRYYRGGSPGRYYRGGSPGRYRLYYH